MGASMGVFKGLYRGQGIYWDGAYTLDGSGNYRTMGEAHSAVDRMTVERERLEAEERQRAVDNGAIVCVRAGDSVTVRYPDKAQETMTIRQFRQRVFDIESSYNRDTVIVAE